MTVPRVPPSPSAEPTRLEPGRLALLLCLAVLAFLYLVPTFGVLLSSLKSTQEISAGQLWTWPATPDGGNYAEVMTNPAVWRYLLNTVAVGDPQEKTSRSPRQSILRCTTPART